jgi:Family of unknown function (DUF6338)
VILATLASLAILAVTAAPGRVFERRVDQRAPRQFRSSFAEYVELVMVGSATTLLGLLVVASGAGALFNFLDLSQLLNHPKDYVKEDPHTVVGCFLIAVALSFVIADTAARFLYRKPKNPRDSAYRQHTIWFDSFEKERPGDKAVSVSAELANGLQLSGILRGFTPTEDDNRELRVQPVVLRRSGAPPTRLPDDQFVLLRESQVVYLIGEYSGMDEDNQSGAG